MNLTTTREKTTKKVITIVCFIQTCHETKLNNEGLYNTQMPGRMKKPWVTQTISLLYTLIYAHYVQENRGNMNIRRKKETHQRNGDPQNLTCTCHLTITE